MTATIYRLASLSNLVFGHHILPPKPFHYKPFTSVNSTAWHTPAGAFTAREIISIASPLLNSVIFRVGNGTPSLQDRDTLIDGLALSLSTFGRESALPLPAAALDSSRKELYSQAERIGKTLTGYVREFTIPETDLRIRIRSRCDGHLWSAPVASLLTGPRGGSDVMMLYNEWIHQIILLRDALLPFENYEEVRLVHTEEHKGMRGSERARKVFLADMVAGQVAQGTIAEMAMACTARSLQSGNGYGFQYESGIVLPASLDTGEEHSLHLLRYHPARVDMAVTELLFEYEYPAYFDAPRSKVPNTEKILQKNEWPPSTFHVPDAATYDASILAQPGSASNSRVLSLQLSFDDKCTRVDLGQIARGQRFAYLPKSATASTVSTAGGLSVPAAVHNPRDILLQPGLVTSEKASVHVIPVTSPLVALALLGKIYPENVILMSKKKDHEPVLAEAAGKGFGVRFILWQDYE